MSVPEGKRTKSAMEVHIKARELAVYTAKILSNEKIFVPSVDTEIINRIRNCAYDICVKAWSANKIRANTNQVNREIVICGGNLMCISKLLRGAEAKLFRENEALKRKIAEEQLRRMELEDAVVELGELFAEQDDALVELAEMIVEV